MSLRSTTTNSRKRFATALVAGVAVDLPRRLHRQRIRATTTTTTATRTPLPPAAPTTRPATRSSSGSPPPPPTTAGWADHRRRPQTEAEKYDDIELRVAEGTNDVDRPDQPGRDLHQRRGRRHRAAALRRRRDDADRARGDGGRHPGHQRRPRVRRPERRARHGPRRQLRHGRLRRASSSASSSATTPTPSSPRSPASTRCR